MKSNEAIRISTADRGKSYSASLARDVKGEKGAVLLPEGAAAVLLVTAVSSEEKETEGTDLTILLRSVNLNGQAYMLHTKPVSKTPGDSPAQTVFTFRLERRLELP